MTMKRDTRTALTLMLDDGAKYMKSYSPLLSIILIVMCYLLHWMGTVEFSWTAGINLAFFVVSCAWLSFRRHQEGK